MLFLGETGSQGRGDQGGPSLDSDMRNEGQNGAGDICLLISGVIQRNKGTCPGWGQAGSEELSLESEVLGLADDTPVYECGLG